MVNTNMSFIQKTVVVNETFLHGSVALVILGLLCYFPRLHKETPYSVGSLSLRDRPVPGISGNTKHLRDTHLCPTGFEHPNPASQRSWTHALDRVVPEVDESHWLNVLRNC